MGRYAKAKSGIALSNGFYDFLSYLTKYILPGLGTLYFGLARIWDFPYGEEVIGSLVLVEAFLGIVIGLSQRTYQGAGEIVFKPDEEGVLRPSIAANYPLEDLDSGKSVQMTVIKQD